MSSPEEIAASALAGMDHGTNNKNNEPASVGAADPAEAAEAPDSQQGNDPGNEKPRRRRGPKPKIKLLVEPLAIQILPRRKEYVNHSYRDFSTVPAEPDWKLPTCIEQMTFSEKVHDILTKYEEYGKYMSWQPHGRAFHIHVPAMFEKHVCPTYFGHKRYSSFLRHLNNYGFKHISKGIDRNCYYHECILRGLPHLCRYMPEAKDARRQIPDPENEPDFAAISEMYPLPALSEVVPKSNSAFPVSVGAPAAAEVLASQSRASGAKDASNANPSTVSLVPNVATASTRQNDGKTRTRSTQAAITSPSPSETVPPVPVVTNNPLLDAAVVAINPLTAAASNPLFAAVAGNPMVMASAMNTANRHLLNPFVKASTFPDDQSIAASLGSASAASSLAAGYPQLQQSSSMSALAQIGYLQKLLAQKQQMSEHVKESEHELQQQQKIPAPVPPQASLPTQIGRDRSTSIAEIRRLQGQLVQSAIPPQKTVMDRDSALTEIKRLQEQLATGSSAFTGAAAKSSPIPPQPSQQQRRGMDRNEALAEISQLRARLASELSGRNNIEVQMAPPAKRQATTVVAGSASPTVAQNISRIPQPFSRSHDATDVESFLQRDAIVSAIRRHQEQQQQQGGEASLENQQRQILEFQQFQRHQQEHQQRQMQAMHQLETLRNVLGQQHQARHNGDDVSLSSLRQRQHGQDHTDDHNRSAVGNPSSASSISEFLRHNARFS